MFDSEDALESSIHDHLADYRFYSRQSWVAPAMTSDHRKIHDVIIVGAGQNGLALAYNLKLRGIRRILIFDTAGLDKAGPWSSFARMPRLRTPKAIHGPEGFNPLLSFKAWFCSKYPRAEYEKFDFIPLAYWREYLAWYRRVLDIEVTSNSTVTDIQWQDDDDCIRARVENAADGTEACCYARKICLATGMTAAGRWSPPGDLADGLPAHCFWCAWDPIDWSDLQGRTVAVIGAGASAFDNASRALQAGSRDVTVFGRTPFPGSDLYFTLWRGRDDSAVFPEESAHPAADILDPLLAHNAGLSDSERALLMARLFRRGRSPASPEYLSRVDGLSQMTVRDECPVEGTCFDAAAGKVRLTAKGEDYSFDRIIFATGPQNGLGHRPELASFRDEILTWGDVTRNGDALPGGLGELPAVSAHYQLRSKYRSSSPLDNIYFLGEVIGATVGLQSVSYMAANVADHIGLSLYQGQFSHNLELAEGMEG
jgi:FAD-dependent urate hydroxylase